MKRTMVMILATGWTYLVGSQVDATLVGTYVDAVANPANGTVNTTPASAFPGGFVYSGSFGDNLWDERLSGTLSNTVMEAGATSDENPPVLTTTVSGLTLGTYNIYVLYWGRLDYPASASWGIQAKLNSTSFGVGDNYYDLSGFDTGDHLGGVVDLREVFLGQVSNATGFSVGIGNYVPLGVNPRTWYEGVAYEFIPEPSSAAFALLAGCVLFMKRLRRR